MTQEMLLANFSREMHTNNSMEAGRRADGRATVAPHEQMQFISVSFPHFNTLPGRLLLGNPASLLHSCSAFLLPPPSALTAALGLGRGMTACAPSSLQAEILPLHQHSKTGRSCTRRKMRVQRTLHFLRHGELCSSCFLLHTDSGQGGYWLPIIQFFCLCGCHSVQATGILGR